MSKITRENWVSHPHYHSSGASFLITIHDSFRQNLNKINILIKKNEIKKASYIYEHLEDTLHHHHHIEEVSLFRFIEKLNLKQNSIKLNDDHKLMSRQLEEVTKLFEKYNGDCSALESKFKDLQDHLLQHLICEEDISIPVIIEYGFDRIFNH
jgi:iron-sulfur cluster repair protein YtfE (RIC family)